MEQKIKSDINGIVKRKYKSEDQKGAIKNVIKLLNDYSKIASKAKHR